jgi:hypothetical protein
MAIFTKGSNINDSIYGKSNYPIAMMIEEQDEAYQKTTQLRNIFSMRTTNQFGVKYSEITAKQNFKVTGEGGVFPRSTQRQGYEKQIDIEEYKNSFEISETMIEDAEAVDVVALAKNFIQSHLRTRELTGAVLLDKGHTTTGARADDPSYLYNTTGADGLSLFNTAHTSITGGYTTQSNYFNASFNYDNLCYAEEAMQSFRDHDGNLLNIQPDTIIIPNKARIKKAVWNAIGAEGGEAGTGDYGYNFQYGRWNVVVWNVLSNASGSTSDNWYLMDSKRNMIDGLIWLDRIALKVDSNIDVNTGNNVFNARYRQGFGAVNWRTILACKPGVGGSTFS